MLLTYSTIGLSPGASAALPPTAVAASSSTSAQFASRAARATMSSLAGDGRADGDIPARWLAVPEHERPARWRRVDNAAVALEGVRDPDGDAYATDPVAYDLEDGSFSSYDFFGSEVHERYFPETIPVWKAPPSAAPSVGDDSPVEGVVVPAAAGKSVTVGEIVSVDDLLKACVMAQFDKRLVVLKLYSKKCRACAMIMPMFKRLARRQGTDVDCYTAEVVAARPLVERLGVASVPTILVFDPTDVTELSRRSIAPAEFKKYEKKVDRAVTIFRDGRRGLLRRYGKEWAEDLLNCPTVGGQKEEEAEPACICVDDDGERTVCVRVPQRGMWMQRFEPGPWLGEISDQLV